MGNSEVGHLTIGAGRRLYQDLGRVNRAIEDGSFFENEALRRRFERGARVHLLGLVSHGGVHSHIDHVRALFRFAPEKTWLHAFTDGRDVSPHAAADDLADLPADASPPFPGATTRWIATSAGSERSGRSTPLSGIGRRGARSGRGRPRAATTHGVTDEFIEPVVFEGTPESAR